MADIQWFWKEGPGCSTPEYPTRITFDVFPVVQTVVLHTTATSLCNSGRSVRVNTDSAALNFFSDLFSFFAFFAILL